MCIYDKISLGCILKEDFLSIIIKSGLLGMRIYEFSKISNCVQNCLYQFVYTIGQCKVILSQKFTNNFNV